jgi:hypothetical protein
MTFEYKPSDPTISTRAAQGGGNSRYDNALDTPVGVWVPAEGKNRVRILPRTWGDDEGPAHWGYEVAIHYGIGPDNGSFLCNQTMKGEACPICDERSRLNRLGDEEGAKAIRVSRAVVVYVVDRDKPQDSPKLWKMPMSIFRDICDLSCSGNTVLPIDHPVEGFDIEFRRAGQGLMTKYSGLQISRDATPAMDSPDELERVLRIISENPIPAAFNYKDAAYIARVFGSTEAPAPTADAPAEEPYTGQNAQPSADAFADAVSRAFGG